MKQRHFNGALPSQPPNIQILKQNSKEFDQLIPALNKKKMRLNIRPTRTKARKPKPPKGFPINQIRNMLTKRKQKAVESKIFNDLPNPQHLISEVCREHGKRQHHRDSETSSMNQRSIFEDDGSQQGSELGSSDDEDQALSATSEAIRLAERHKHLVDREDPFKNEIPVEKLTMDSLMAIEGCLERKLLRRLRMMIAGETDRRQREVVKGVRDRLKMFTSMKDVDAFVKKLGDVSVLSKIYIEMRGGVRGSLA